MKSPLYFLYAMLVMGLGGFAQYRGWSFLNINEVRNVPKTVRDNPGAYRSHYAGYYRYFGGK